MSQLFRDHFAAVASSYADFRPTYPRSLFTWLASLVPQHELVWDCAAGSGQASVDLATHFARVVATQSAVRHARQLTDDSKIGTSTAKDKPA